MTGACHSVELSSPYVHSSPDPTVAAKFLVGNSTQFLNYFFPVEKAHIYKVTSHLEITENLTLKQRTGPCCHLQHVQRMQWGII